MERQVLCLTDAEADCMIKVTTILGAGLVTSEVLSGLGRHSYYLNYDQRRNLQALGWADWIQTFITLALMKISICLFLLRIVDSRRVVRGMYTMIGFVSLFTLVSICLFLGICRPLKSYWDIGVDGVCLSKHQVEMVVLAQGSKHYPFYAFEHVIAHIDIAVLSTISDLVLAALPAIFLRNLQISFRTKVALCMLMGLGVM